MSGGGPPGSEAQSPRTSTDVQDTHVTPVCQGGLGVSPGVRVGTCAEGAQWLARASQSLVSDPAQSISQASLVCPPLAMDSSKGGSFLRPGLEPGGLEGWVASPRGQATREARVQGPPARSGLPLPPPRWCIRTRNSSPLHPGTVCQLNPAFPSPQPGFRGAASSCPRVAASATCRKQ